MLLTTLFIYLPFYLFIHFFTYLPSSRKNISERTWKDISPMQGPQGGTCCIRDRGGGGSDRGSYCEPKKIHDWAWNFKPKKIPGIKIFYPKNTRLNTSILMYSIKQTLRPKKKYVKNLLTQKNTEGVNFQPKKIRRTSPSCMLQVSPHGTRSNYATYSHVKT